MKIIDYFESDRHSYWLAQIKTCDWRAGQYLAQLLETNTFHQTVGETSKLLLLVEGDDLMAFATYAERDCIDDPALTPWLGFVYTYPPYRGQRRMGYLIEHIAARACADGHAALYVCTDHDGLYEKYGFTWMADRLSIYGEMSRVLCRALTPLCFAELTGDAADEPCDVQLEYDLDQTQEG